MLFFLLNDSKQNIFLINVYATKNSRLNNSWKKSSFSLSLFFLSCPAGYPQLGIKPMPTEVEAHSLNPSTVWEIPGKKVLFIT